MNHVTLWYDTPATTWAQGLPIGNGRMGAVVIADGPREQWIVNESTFWSGRQERTPTRSEGRADLDRARELLFADDYRAAEELAAERFMPEKGNFGTNLQMCAVLISHAHAGEGLRRELDLDEAIVRTSYAADAVRFARTTFASHADDVIVSHVTASAPGQLFLEVEVEERTPEFRSWVRDGDSIVFETRAIETRHSDGRCGVRGAGVVKVDAIGGSVRADGGRILIEAADEARIIFSAATDYGQEGDGWMLVPAERVQAAAAKTTGNLVSDHVADHREIYGRVELDLGDPADLALPTDRRVGLVRDGGDDPHLMATFYQYGRYLMVAGSRADSPLPLNLQGLWNDGEANRMSWSCDYHLDVNTEMNYYPVEPANLSECALPLARFVERLVGPGQQVAQDFYGCEGWVVHVFTNAWLFAAPGWNYTWGLNVTGGLWLALQLRETYRFSRDRRFLAETAYPVLRGAALFYLDYMTTHPASGWLVTGPSNSPENSFYPGAAEDGEFRLSMGPTMDQVLVRELFDFCAEAADALGVDEELQVRLRNALATMPPLRVGRTGQLQEWLDDHTEAQPDHRHMSHLYALYPGGDVTPDGTPDLARAARTTLETRGARDALEDVEFTVAQFAASFARLWDGDAAHEQIAHLVAELCFDNLLTYSRAGVGGAETSIFVVDGNFGGTAAIGEMLLQSHSDKIRILPALPRAWDSGSYAGLRARGNVEVDAVWRSGALVSATIKAFAAGRTRIAHGDVEVVLDLEAGNAYALDENLRVVRTRPLVAQH